LIPVTESGRWNIFFIFTKDQAYITPGGKRVIIDAHCHVFDKNWYPLWFQNILNSFLSRRFGLPPESMADLRQKSLDSSGDIFVNNMDKAGVDKAIVCISDLGLTASPNEFVIPIEEVNRLASAMVKRHPDRLYFAAGVDPRRKNAEKIAETAIKELGATSLKLHPATGWYPNDKAVYPIYKICLEFGVPVNFHTGPFYYPTRSKYCHPMHLEDVAVDFPDLTIHCTHTGDLLFMDMIALAKVYRNMILDLAAWQGWLKGSRSTAVSFYRIMRFIMDVVGPRFVFASDWSGLVNDAPYCEWVKAFTEIPDWVKEAGIEFSPKEIEGYLGKNALKFLHPENNKAEKQ
jgi:uncharacterized protein